ncbi:GumC family protein [Terriglobus albidus]|nr:Wzz/FepE/Etk N-terminal domain-containing protein [Terriglobus albidus]
METEQTASHTSVQSDGIDLTDILCFLFEFRRQIVVGTCIAFVAGVITAFFILKPVFTATTIILPPQQDHTANNLLVGQLGALGGLGGATSAFGLKNPADMYVGILGSREIADHIVSRFHLMDVYRKKMRLDARKMLRSNSDFEAAKDGLIYINVKDHDPQRAAALANAYVDELHDANTRLAISQASQRRLFYDNRLAEEKKALVAAEDDLKQTQERTGLVQLSGQAEMTIRNIASIQAQIAAREVELSRVRTYATDENPEAERLREEIATERAQLARLQDSEPSPTPGNTQVPAAKVPAIGLDYLRKLREERTHEELYVLMTKQREMASLEEAKSAPVIQVVDHAEVPERKSGPVRTLIVLSCTIAGFVLTCCGVIARNLLRKAIGNDLRSRLAAIRLKNTQKLQTS